MNFLERALDGKNQWWRYLIVLLGAFLIMNFIGGIPLMIFMFKQTLQTGAIPDSNSLSASLNMNFFLMMFVFAVGLFATVLLIRVLHKRSFPETVNGTKKVRWGRCFFGFGIWFGLSLIYMAIGYYLEPEQYTFQLEWSTFIPLFFLVIIMVPLQTTYEELTFRGYLAQGVGAWTKSRWMVVVLPGILFGLMHVANPEVSEFGFWKMMPQYILFGLIWGLAAVLDDGIELPMGMHAAQNISGCLLMTHESSALQTPAMFSVTIDDFNFIEETVVMLLTGIIVIIICMRKYNWDFSILNKKIEKPEEVSTHEDSLPLQ